jgi:hypothetical protein
VDWPDWDSILKFLRDPLTALVAGVFFALLAVWGFRRFVRWLLILAALGFFVWALIRFEAVRGATATAFGAGFKVLVALFCLIAVVAVAAIVAVLVMYFHAESAGVPRDRGHGVAPWRPDADPAGGRSGNRYRDLAGNPRGDEHDGPNYDLAGGRYGYAGDFDGNPRGDLAGDEHDGPGHGLAGGRYGYLDEGLGVGGSDRGLVLASRRIHGLTAELWGFWGGCLTGPMTVTGSGRWLASLFGAISPGCGPGRGRFAGSIATVTSSCGSWRATRFPASRSRTGAFFSPWLRLPNGCLIGGTGRNWSTTTRCRFPTLRFGFCAFTGGGLK